MWRVALILFIVGDRTLNDPFSRKYPWDANPRQTALEFLVRYYPDHPKTRELLQDRAHNDNDEQLRDWAAQQLRACLKRGDRV